MTSNKHYLQLLLAFTLTMGISGMSAADDTDIYTNGSLTGTSLPNIIFTIDTSGSMYYTYSGAAIPLADKGAYDPNKTYYGYCDLSNDRYYWASGTTTAGSIDCRSTRYSIEAASFHCDDAVNTARDGSLDSNGTGYYSAKFARDDGSTWVALDRDDHTSSVECVADYNVHGSNSAPTPDVYPSDATGTTPWTNSDAPGVDSFDWSTYSDTYTFYNANYINWARMDRMTLVMNVFVNLMQTIESSGAQVNIGLMRYDDGADGGYFIVPVQKVTSTNVQDYIDAILALRPGGYTPLSETYYEAYLYYAGKTARYGATSTPGQNPASMYTSGTTYDSPIEHQCQKSFIVALTDGAPSKDTGANSLIKTLTSSSCSTWSDGDCMDELAEYMANNDCSVPTPTAEQNVITYTIGFGPGASGLTLLQDVATKGKGKFFPATTADDLTNALADVIAQVQSINSTYTAPAVSINAFNRNFHSDELYYALFRPEKGPNWPGNIKVYKLNGTDMIDARDNLAINPATNFTYDSSLSFWTDATDFPYPKGDGGNVELGGAASKLTTSRKLYTYTDSAAPANVLLSSYPLADSNAAITTTLLGDAALTATERADMLKWATGLDIKDIDGDLVLNEPTHSIGDPLHSRPVVVNYGPDPKDLVLYFGTNEGYLHALSIKNEGAEVFAFMPKELLGNIKQRYLGSAISPHVYGMDGPITVWHNDLNNDGKLYDSSGSLQTGEHAYLYIGMRRGTSPTFASPYHNAYYALDITDPARPKLMWQITGGAGGTTGFSEVAQTWSGLKPITVKIGTTERTVLIFSGGYDAETEDVAGNTHTSDVRGRSIYMIDATTGAKLWQAGPAGTAPERASNDPDLVLSDMTNSFPSDVVVFDTNRDGLEDRVYAADVGGQIWRFDINNGTSDMSKFVTGGVIAKLNGTTVENNRRFYHAPAVALTRDRSHLAIAIASGQRAVPLNKDVHDAFFVVKDPYIYETAKDSSDNPIYTYVDTDGDTYGDQIITCCDTVASTGAPHLYDATDDILGAVDGGTLSNGTTVSQADINTARAALGDSHGWYIWLQEMDPSTHVISYIGEKGTGEATIIKNTVSFPTYTPVETASAGVCLPNQGRGIVYTLDLMDGSAVYDRNNDDIVDTEDRVTYEGTGMLDQVQTIILESSWVDCTGMQCYGGGSLTPDKLRWYMPE